jgi:hypothetical protein
MRNKHAVAIATPLQNRAIPRLGRAHGDPTNLEQIVLANDSVQTEEKRLQLL